MSLTRKRTQARELAVQCLYQLDLLGRYDEDHVESTMRWSTSSDDSKTFARELVEACWTRREDLDAEIRKVAEHWALERMAFLDRNILRLAIHELLHRPDIPPKVSINEAIELGKRYSTKGSGAFINGILDRIRLDHPEIPDGPDASDEPKNPDGPGTGTAGEGMESLERSEVTGDEATHPARPEPEPLAPDAEGEDR